MNVLQVTSLTSASSVSVGGGHLGHWGSIQFGKHIVPQSVNGWYAEYNLLRFSAIWERRPFDIVMTINSGYIVQFCCRFLLVMSAEWCQIKWQEHQGSSFVQEIEPLLLNFWRHAQLRTFFWKLVKSEEPVDSCCSLWFNYSFSSKGENTEMNVLRSSLYLINLFI